MVVSGLLSLSIHEELTFEGTEIAIHPDLFTEATASTIGSASVSSSRHSVLTRSGSGTVSLASLATAPVSGSAFTTSDAFTTSTYSPAIHDHKQGAALPYEPQLPSLAESNSVSSNNRKLEVGNLIEIKVWDPRAYHQLNSTKRRSLPPSSLPPNAHIPPESNPAITEWLKGSPSTGTSAIVSKDVPKPSQIPSASRTLDALISPRIVRGSQHQKTAEATEDDSSSTDSNIDTNKKDTIHALPMNQSPRQESPVITGRKGSLVPNPRVRHIAAETHRQGKPPLIQKKLAANGLTVSGASTELRSTAAKLPKPAHFRDISDVTMDTTLAPPVASSDGELGTQSMDSQDESLTDDNFFTKLASTHTLRTSFVMLVTEKTLSSLKGQSRSQISILRQIADLYQLSPYDMVTISRIEKNNESAVMEAVSADFVICTIKDQFISRGYMHSFQKSLIGRWIYEGERLSDSASGIKAHAREIRHADILAKSGIVTEETKITFRSRSTRIIWLVQISSEMWDYSNPYESDNERKEESTCELVFDKFVRFMYKIFGKWKELEVTHSLTVVFFSRTLVNNHHGKTPLHNSRLSRDVYGRYYEDHYKTVIDNETPSDWESLIVRIKREFVRYPFDVGWNLSEENYRRPSTAMQGNLLEAINVTLNLLQFHFLDRDLHRTGNSIVVVSPECGVFEVDRALAGITYQRMMDNGIGSDMVCLGLPPLHVAPFFLYNNFLASDKDRKEGDTPRKSNDAHSEVPHWMHLSFVKYDNEATNHGHIKSIERVSVVAPRDSLNLVDGLTIAPNGFLLREVSSDPQHASSASVARHASSSSCITRSQNQQRQLISGRDFKDILEACRPRTSSYVLPSSLVYLLRIRTQQDGNVAHIAATSENSPPSMSARLASASPSSGRMQLREWGTVDFDEIDGPMSFASAGSRLRSTQTKSPVPGSEIVSAKSSPSSSLASQLFGRSFERADHSFSHSVPRNGFQIQRSPSFEFESDPFCDDDPFVDAENLRNLMNEYDNKFAFEVHSNVRPGLDLSGFVSSIMETDPCEENTDDQPISTSASGNDHSGGLVAALSRYKGSDSSHGSQEPSTAKTITKTRSGGMSYLGVVSEASSRQLSYSSFVGLKVGSEPPGHISHLPAQTLQAFVRSQQQMMVSSACGIESRPGQMSRSISMLSHGPNANLVDRQTSRSPNAIGIGSPSRVASIPTLSLATLPTSNAHSLKIRSRSSKNMKSVVNPFRQQDEDDELEKKSHNRRRWSHVFPLGELEFKRHAGPLWKSLCQPAVLPLTIDYFPTPQEMNDTNAYRYNHYRLTLQGMEHTHYSSHLDLLMEMVRQRITQDFQVVPPSVLSASNAASNGDIQRTLSMGHRIHVLTYDSQSDSIDVKLITATHTDEDKKPITYCYSMYSPFTNSFQRVVQTFEKYSEEYRWNSMDHVILEDIDMELSTPLRCRRLQFELIPPKLDHDGGSTEQEYIDKFKRLLEYLDKIRQKEQSSSDEDLVVQILKKMDDRTIIVEAQNERLGVTDKMKRFKIRLGKGNANGYEWVEVSIDSVFETTRTFRIIFNWLVASTSKVEAQVQLLQRRCVQYGLELISSPQVCISRDLFLNPLAIPEIFCIRQPGKVGDASNWLLESDFIDDGIHMTDPSYLGAIENKHEFSFPLNRRTNQIRSVGCRQFIHRATGAVFVRMIVDDQGLLILAVILNKRRIRDKNLMEKSKSLVERIQSFANSLMSQKQLDSSDASLK